MPSVYSLSDERNSGLRLSSCAFTKPVEHFIEAMRSRYDPVTVLFNLLALVGSYAGRKRWLLVSEQRVYGNLYTAGIGDGPSFCRTVYDVFSSPFDPKVRLESVMQPQKLVFRLRDALTRPEKMTVEPGDLPAYCPTEVDAGEADKRVLVMQRNLLASVTRKLEKARATRGQLIQAWTGEPLDVSLDYRAGGILVCQEPHVCVITKAIRQSDRSRVDSELHKLFVFFETRQACPSFSALTVPPKLRGSMNGLRLYLTRDAGQMILTRAAEQVLLGAINGHTRKAMTEETYGVSFKPEDFISDDTDDVEMPPVAPCDKVCALNQLSKLALDYAMFDLANEITEAHAFAAVAVWEYSQLVQWRFEHRDVINQTRERLIAILKRKPRRSLSTSEIERCVREPRASEIRGALEGLGRSGLVRREDHATPGRTRTVWTWVGEGVD